jgi:hypothetical protein
MANIVDIIIRGIDKTKAGLNAPIRNLKDLGGAAANLAGPMKLAAAATAGAFAYMVKSSIDLADHMAKTSQKIGVPVETLSALKHAASLSGVEFESLTTGLKKMNKNMADTAAGTGEAKTAFAAMGISVKDSEGKMKSTEAVLSEVADKFASFEDGPNKTAIAMKVFGKAGADLIPMLNAGKAGIGEMMQEAERLGIVIDTKTAKASEEFNDNLSRLKQGAYGVALTFAAEVLPSLTSATGAMVSWLKESGAAQTAGKAIATVLKIIAAGGLAIATGFNAAGTAIGGVFAIIATGVTKGPSAAWETAKDVMSELGGQVDVAAKRFAALEAAGTKAGEKVAAAGKGKGAAPFLPDEAAIKKGVDAERKAFEARNRGLAELGRESYDNLVAAKVVENSLRDEELARLKDYNAQYLEETRRFLGEQAKIKEDLMNMAETGAGETLDFSYSAESAYEAAYAYGDVANAIALINGGLGEQWAALEEGQTSIAAYRDLFMDANKSIKQSAVEVGMAMREVGVRLGTDVLTGAMKAKDAVKQLGKAAVSMVVEYALKWVTAQVAMAVFGKAAKAAEVAMASVTGAAVAAAWAPAAAMVAIATLGGAAAPAAAALTATTALASTLAIAGIAHGGLENVPSESTFLLQRGERVLSPRQNKDLTEYLDGRGDSEDILGGGTPVQQPIILQIDGEVLVQWIHKASRTGVLRLVPS